MTRNPALSNTETSGCHGLSVVSELTLDKTVTRRRPNCLVSQPGSSWVSLLYQVVEPMGSTLSSQRTQDFLTAPKLYPPRRQYEYSAERRKMSTVTRYLGVACQSVWPVRLCEAAPSLWQRCLGADTRLLGGEQSTCVYEQASEFYISYIPCTMIDASCMQVSLTSHTEEIFKAAHQIGLVSYRLPVGQEEGIYCVRSLVIQTSILLLVHPLVHAPIAADRRFPAGYGIITTA